MHLLIQKILASFQNLGPHIVLGFTALAFIMLAEVVFLGYRRSSLHHLTKPDASARKDMLSFFLDVTGLLRILGHLITLGTAYVFGLVINSALNLNLTGAFADPVVQVVFWIFVKSFLDYWMHRFLHAVPMLWEIHKYHHSAAEFNVVTAHRESVLVAPWSSFYFAIPLGILGTPPTVFIPVAFLLEAHALLVHSRFMFSWGRFGDWFLISPRAHRMHHSIDMNHWGHNYGFTFAFWDHLFGTYWVREVPQELPVGVPDCSYNSISWVREQVCTVQSFGSEFMKAVRRIRGGAAPVLPVNQTASVATDAKLDVPR